MTYDAIEETTKDLFATEVGKRMIEAVEGMNLKEIAEQKAVRVLAEVQRIIKDEELSEVLQIRMIEEIFLKNNLDIGGLCE